jgi:hypothetical protein
MSLPKEIDRPKDAPSRGRVLGHGSARFRAYRDRRTKAIDRSGLIVRSFRSLAPPKKNLLQHLICYLLSAICYLLFYWCLG